MAFLVRVAARGAARGLMKGDVGGDFASIGRAEQIENLKKKILENIALKRISINDLDSKILNKLGGEEKIQESLKEKKSFDVARSNFNAESNVKGDVVEKKSSKSYDGTLDVSKSMYYNKNDIVQEVKEQRKSVESGINKEFEEGFEKNLRDLDQDSWQMGTDFEGRLGKDSRKKGKNLENNVDGLGDVVEQKMDNSGKSESKIDDEDGSSLESKFFHTKAKHFAKTHDKFIKDDINKIDDGQLLADFDSKSSFNTPGNVSSLGSQRLNRNLANQNAARKASLQSGSASQTYSRGQNLATGGSPKSGYPRRTGSYDPTRGQKSNSWIKNTFDPFRKVYDNTATLRDGLSYINDQANQVNSPIDFLLEFAMRKAKESGVDVPDGGIVNNNANNNNGMSSVDSMLMKKTENSNNKALEPKSSRSGLEYHGNSKTAMVEHHLAGKTAIVEHHAERKMSLGEHHLAEKTAMGEHHAERKMSLGEHHLAEKIATGEHRLERKAEIQEHRLEGKAEIQEHRLEGKAEIQEHRLEGKAEIQEHQLERKAEIQEHQLERKAEIQEHQLERKAEIEQNLIGRKASIEESLIEAKAEIEQNLIEAKAEIEQNLIGRRAEIEQNLIGRKADIEQNLIERKAEVEQNLIGRRASTEQNLTGRKADIEQNLIERKTEIAHNRIDMKAEIEQNHIEGKAGTEQNRIEGKAETGQNQLEKKSETEQNRLERKSEIERNRLERKAEIRGQQLEKKAKIEEYNPELPKVEDKEHTTHTKMLESSKQEGTLQRNATSSDQTSHSLLKEGDVVQGKEESDNVQKNMDIDNIEKTKLEFIDSFDIKRLPEDVHETARNLAERTYKDIQGRNADINEYKEQIQEKLKDEKFRSNLIKVLRQERAMIGTGKSLGS